MNSTRQNKVSRLLQKDLSDIFQKEGRNLFGGTLITVTTVRISPDLKVAKVYISIFPTEKREETLQKINENAKFVRHELGKRIRHQLKSIPELAFFIDDSLDYADNIEKLLNS